MALKELTPRNAKYLAYIRTNNCFACGHPPRPGEIQAAHVRIGSMAGMGMKSSDYHTIPLCASCHAKQHHIGERTFWEDLGIDPYIVMARYIAGYFPDPRRAVHLLESLIEHERGNREIFQPWPT